MNTITSPSRGSGGHSGLGTRQWRTFFEAKAPVAAEQRRGGKSERQGERGFLTGGGERDAQLMPLCRGNCSAGEFIVLPPNS